MKHRIVPFFFPNQGCSQRCVYCDQNWTRGEAFTWATPEEVVLALRKANDLRRSGRDEVVEAAFFGGTFTALPVETQKRYLEPTAALRSQGIVDAVRVSTHPSHVDPQALDLLRNCAVDTVELGIQSFDDAVLTASGRGYRGERAEEACQAVTEAGFRLVVQLMTHLPGSSAETDQESARITSNIAPEAVRIFPTVVLDGTELALRLAQRRYTPATPEDAAERAGRMMRPLLDAGVTILRVGLQNSVLLDRHVIAGPYHPSLGEMAWACLLADTVATLVRQARSPGIQDTSGGLRIRIDHRLSSLLSGHGGFGLRCLAKRLDMDIEQVSLEVAPSLDSQSIGRPGSEVAASPERAARSAAGECLTHSPGPARRAKRPLFEASPGDREAISLGLGDKATVVLYNDRVLIVRPGR